VIDNQSRPRFVDSIKGQGGIDLFRESVKKWIRNDPAQYFLGDARKTPFKDGTFDTIFDRATHKFVCDQSYWIFCRAHNMDHDEAKLNAAEHLISEYERILKKGGKIIILFSDVSFYPYFDSVFYSLKKRNFSLIQGKAKSSLTITLSGRVYITSRKKVHKIMYYVVAIKN